MTRGMASRNKTQAAAKPATVSALTTTAPTGSDSTPVVASSLVVTRIGVTGFRPTIRANVPAVGTG